MDKTYLKYIIAILFTFSVLLCLRWAWSELFYTSDQHRPVNGVLDLHGINLENSPPFYLDGEWQFYPGPFVSSQDIQSKEHAPRHIHVPGDWRSALNNDSGSSYGYGTYRLRILTDPLEEPVAFWLKGIEAASQVELNGIAEKSIGKPASNVNEYKPKNISYTASYSDKGTTEIELLIHVANFDEPFNGGILNSIRFGSQAAIDFVRWYSIGFQLFTFFILLLHGLYACIFYLFNRQEQGFFMTFLLLLTTGIAIMSAHENILLLWLPINYTWAIKIRLISLLWQNLLILLIFRRFASAPPRNVWLRIYISGIVCFTGILLAAPASWVNGMIHYNIFILFYLFAFAWFLYTAGTMVFKKQADNDVVFLLVCAVGITSNLTWSILEYILSIINITTVYYPIDIVVALIGFSTYWFKQYLRNARANAMLNEQLKEADKLKDQFLANTSHELRTPLHGIMNIAETVVTNEKEKLNESSLKDMELLITISRRMSHMLGDLLDVASFGNTALHCIKSL